jgi:2-hydroxy-3-oxopropionate reductase
MEVKGHKMVAGDFAVQARLSQHAKDVRIMLEEAARAGAELPMSELHLRLLEEAEAAGWGELDNSAIVRVYERRATSRERREKK